MLSVEVASMINRNQPTRLDTLEDMLQESLANSGFCCPAKVDSFLKKRAAQAIGVCQRSIPEFDPEWLTLAGAVQHMGKLHSEGFWDNKK